MKDDEEYEEKFRDEFFYKGLLMAAIIASFSAVFVYFLNSIHLG